MARAEHWIVRRQEADGSWGGIQPPWVYSLIALHLGGYPLDHPVMRRGLEGIERFMVEDRDDSRGVGAPPGPSRRLEACQSPVWDTALSMLALSDAGVAGEHPAMVAGAEWLLAEEVTGTRRLVGRAPGLRPGGWAFEFANDNYPDVDDTAEVVLALQRVLAAVDLRGDVLGRAARNGSAPAADLPVRIEGALARAVEWVEGMQSRDGGWGAFDADNTRALARELPFLDFGEVIDEPSADVTAHAVEMLAALGLARERASRRGVRWLIDSQEADGSWFGRWGVNHVYGTGAVVPALVAAGVSPSTGARPAGRALARAPPERRRRLGRGPALIRRSALDRARPQHRLADRVGAARAARRRRALAGAVAGGRLAGRHAAPRRHLGRAAVHGHRLPVRLLHQLPPVPADVPADGARALPEARRGPGPRGRPAGSASTRGVSLVADAPSGARAIHASGGTSSTPAPEPVPAPVALPPPAAIRARARTENFPVAGPLLGRRAREQLLAIYDFARLVDELGDSAEGDRLAALEWVEGELDRAVAGTAAHPVFVAVGPPLHSHALPREPFARLIEANRVDQRVSRYRTWEELRGYCRLSADPVGELVLGVFGAADAPRIALSDSVCTGLQLTEHLQDIAEDYARGRIYMPLEELERFAVAEADLAAGAASPAVRALVAFELQRGRSLLYGGVPLIGQVPRRAGLAVAGFIAGGLAALTAIERAGHDVLAGSPRAGRGLFARTLLHTLARSRRVPRG